MHEAGKGSKQRPIEDQEQFDKNWEVIFGCPTSPCVSVCEIDFEKKICHGCFRTLDEIEAWYHANDDEKRRIMRNIEERKQCRKS